MEKETFETTNQPVIPETRVDSDYPTLDSSLPLISADPNSNNVDSLKNAIKAISEFVDNLEGQRSWEDAVNNRAKDPNAVSLEVYINDVITFYIQGIYSIIEDDYPPSNDKFKAITKLRQQIIRLQDTLATKGITGINIFIRNNQLISECMQTTPAKIKSPDENQGHISIARKDKILKGIKSQMPIEVWLALREAIKYSNFDETTEPFSIQRLFGHTFAIKRVLQHYGLHEILLEDANKWEWVEINGLYKLSASVNPPGPRTVWKPGPIAGWLQKNGINITIEDDKNDGDSKVVCWDYCKPVTAPKKLGKLATA